MQKIFTSVYDFFHRRRTLAGLCFFLSLAVWIWCASRINLQQNITDMLPENEAIHAMNDVISRTEAGEQVIFMLSFRDSLHTDPDSLIYLSGEFRDAMLAQCGSWIDALTLQPGGTDAEEQLAGIINNHLPLFLTDADYARIDSLRHPEQLNTTLAANRKLLLSPAGIVYKQLVAGDPVGISGIVWSRLADLRPEGSHEFYDGFLFTDSNRTLNFFLKPRYRAAETGENSKFFKALDELIESWESQHPDLKIIYFGGPAVAAGNAQQMQQDTVLTLGITVVLLLAVTYYYFRRKRTPFLLLVPVIYGAATGLGVTWLVQGSLSVIALGAGAIILGIAIDFSIHFLSHTRHTSGLRDTVKEMAHPLTIGSFTTIAAFLALRLTDTPLLRDLGLFAAASLAGAALCTLVFMPHMPVGKAREEESPTLFDRLARLNPEKNKWLTGLIILLTPIFLFFSFRVGFDDDLMHMNYLSPKLKQAEQEVSRTHASALSSVFLVSGDANREQALRKMETVQPVIDSLRARGLVRSISNPAALLPSDAEQAHRIERWNRYWSSGKQTKLFEDLETAAARQGYAPGAFDAFREMLRSAPQPLDTSSQKLLQSLFPGGFSGDTGRQYVIASLKVPAEHRQTVFSYFEKQQSVTVTDRQQGAAQLLEILNADFSNITLYSSLIVFFALLIGYGRIELALMSFLPMAISWIWILGIMALLGLQFNIVNIIISTLIFGLGDDYSIFTTDGLVERYRTGTHKLRKVRAAVYISVTTVIIGLGVLLLAKHPALRSIAFISVTGILCVLLISQTLQPFLFNWFIQRRADKGFFPFTLWSFAKSVFAFFYFFAGSMFLTVLGLILTRIRPFGRERSIYYFHVWISRMTRSMMYIMMNVRKRVVNRHLADFSRPAVYIANHSSFLDILATTMLHPRMILLTNKWVWRSPVFGAVVRMAEYYPVAEGAQDSIAPLKDLVSRGYSIVVFPEGTRSADGKIRRFHKGAFYIAEQLKLDLVPLLLHGISYCMQKGDFLLKDGTSSIYFYPRIAPEDPHLGSSYSERARHAGRFMRSELAGIREAEETPSYFREQLLRSYTYKGPVLEWYCRIKTRLEGNYESFHKLLPRQGRFYDLGCGYGFMSYMLHWAAPERDITGVDYDEDKIITAQNNFLKDEGIRFLHADLTVFTPEPCRGIIISDVLHYLVPEAQEALLQRCVSALQPGGILIIRDGMEDMDRRHRTTKLTEVFSTRVFSFNKTANNLHFLNRSYIEAFAARYNMKLEVSDHTRLTSNLTFVLQLPDVPAADRM